MEQFGLAFCVSILRQVDQGFFCTDSMDVSFRGSFDVAINYFGEPVYADRIASSCVVLEPLVQISVHKLRPC